MGTAELHHRMGKCVAERERIPKIPQKSILSGAYACGVPVYASSPGENSIGMNVATVALSGVAPRMDVLLDVIEPGPMSWPQKGA